MVVKSLLKASLKSKLSKKKKGSQKGKTVLQDETQARSDASRGISDRSARDQTALYNAQAKVRELAADEGVRVATFRKNNPNNSAVKTIYRIKPDIKAKDGGRGSSAVRKDARPEPKKITAKPTTTPSKGSTVRKSQKQQLKDRLAAVKKTESFKKAEKKKQIIPSDKLDNLTEKQFMRMLGDPAKEAKLGKARIEKYFEKFGFYDDLARDLRSEGVPITVSEVKAKPFTATKKMYKRRFSRRRSR
jgi:hypothetical protein